MFVGTLMPIFTARMGGMHGGNVWQRGMHGRRGMRGGCVGVTGVMHGRGHA